MLNTGDNLGRMKYITDRREKGMAMATKKWLGIATLAGSLFALSFLPANGPLDALEANKAHAASDVMIYVDGNQISSDVPPAIVDGRTLVPVRAIGESLSAQVAWNNELRTVTVAKTNMVMSLQVNKQTYILNGMIKSLDVPVQIIGNRTMVPLRVIGESFGAQVEWDNATRSVKITNAGSVAPAKQDSLAVQAQNGKVRVSYDKVNVRTGPSTNDSVVTQVNTGDILTLTGASGDWYRVTLADGRSAFIANWLVSVYDPTVNTSQPSDPSSGASPAEPTPSPAPAPSPEPAPVLDSVAGKTFVSAYDSVNLRSGPGVGYDKVGQVDRGASFTGVAVEGDWTKVDYQGKIVWVSTPLLTTDIANNPPVVSTPVKTLGVLDVKREVGQAWVTFDVGNADAYVVNNDRETLAVQIDGVQAPTSLTNPVAGVSPFTNMKIENIGTSSVRITSTVTTNGYYRLDRNNERFSIMGVAKHKNGQTGLAGKTIVLDPGHGNYAGDGKVDPGAISAHNGLSEVDFNTPLSFYLKEMLEAAGANVIMTRGWEPNNVTLTGRAIMANDNSADAFISIHGDSAANTSAYGAGTWLYTGNLRLTSAAQEDMRNEFAQAINSGIAQATNRPAYIKYANFAVTRENEVPCVLIESAFLSNPTDAALLATSDYQKKVATGIYQGLANYFSY